MSQRNKWILSAVGATVAVAALWAHPRLTGTDFMANEAALTLWGSAIFIGVACIGVAILSPTRRK